MEKKYDFSASSNTKSKDELIIEDNAIIYFVDDIFTVHKERIKQILHMMIDEKFRNEMEV